MEKECEQTRFRILDLFCGAGGFSFGMAQNPNFCTVLAVDMDEGAAETFRRNFPETEMACGDLTDMSVKKHLIYMAKELQVNTIIGGPPCQGFSLKGKKLGLSDPRNFLFREYLEMVREIQPDVFVIENVKNILSASNGWFKDEIVSSIQALGYTVQYDILNAKHFGVPQSRERAFFVCSRIGDIALPKGNERIVTVRDAISDLSYLNSGEGEFMTIYKKEPESEYQRERRKGGTSLYNHVATNHSAIALKKLSMIPSECGKECLPVRLHGRQLYDSTWGRLKWNEVSPTIDTRFDTPSNGRNSHPELDRAITPREAARIQSFDDSFVFYGNRSQVRRQIGNAVPPLMAKAIADRIASY